MLNMTLGSGIMWASLFLALGTVAVVWINNVYKSCGGEEPATSSDSGSKNNGLPVHNGYVRKGEHDESIRSLHQRLSDMHKENKGWWKELDGKVDDIRNELRDSMSEQRKINDNLNHRITQVETVQKMRKKGRSGQDPEESSAC